MCFIYLQLIQFLFSHLAGSSVYLAPQKINSSERLPFGLLMKKELSLPPASGVLHPPLCMQDCVSFGQPVWSSPHVA